MRKIVLVTIGLMLVLFSLPIILGAQNQIVLFEGNSSILYYNISTVQLTPLASVGGNVTYITNISIDSGTAAYWNISYFILALPDNHSSQVASSFVLSNGTNITHTANVFILGDYNAVNFTPLNGSWSNATGGWANETSFNITWTLLAPVGATKVLTTLAGRTYTETWNITSAASNLTIKNASLVVLPSFWHTRVGAPTVVTFNNTAMTNYTANYTGIDVWLDLNVNVTDMNMMRLSSGYETLSISYNGPEISASSGSTPSAAVSVIPTTAREISLWAIGIIAVLLVIGGVTWLVLGLRKR